MEDRLRKIKEKLEIILNFDANSGSQLTQSSITEREHHQLLLEFLEEDSQWLIEQATKVPALERFKSYFAELYGQGLQIAGWHLNGELEPYDSFYDDTTKLVESDNADVS